MPKIGNGPITLTGKLTFLSKQWETVRDEYLQAAPTAGLFWLRAEMVSLPPGISWTFWPVVAGGEPRKYALFFDAKGGLPTLARILASLGYDLAKVKIAELERLIVDIGRNPPLVRIHGYDLMEVSAMNRDDCPKLQLPKEWKRA